MKPSLGAFRRVPPNSLGDRRFWDVVEQVSAEMQEAWPQRNYFTFEEWARIFAATDTEIELPTYIWRALVRRRRRIEEANDLGQTAAEMARDDAARERMQRANRDQHSDFTGAAA